MMNLLLMPENSKENGLDLSTASIVLAPAILYKKSVTSPDMATTRSSNHSQHLDLRYAAVGAQVIERMLKHQEEIFKEIRLEVSDALENLEHKKQSLLSVYQMSKIKPQVQFPSDKQQLEEITFAFRCNSQKYYDGFQSQSNPRTKPFQMVSFGVENENSMEKKSDRKHPMYLSANSIRERREAARVTQEIDEANVTLAATGATTTADTANTSDSAESAESADSTDTVDTAATLNVSDQILMEPPSSTSLFAENTVLHESNVSQTKESSSSIGSCIVEFDPTSEEIANLWKKHGFNRFTTSLLENFENGGVLLLRSVYFVIKNDEKCLEVCLFLWVVVLRHPLLLLQ
jgi:hypothetical protein